MKKIFVLLILIAFALFSSCGLTEVIKTESTTEHHEIITTHIENSYICNEKTTNMLEAQQTPIDLPVEKSNATNCTTDNYTTKKDSEDVLSNEPPPVCYFTLEQLKEFKNACDTMNEDEFAQFVNNSRNLLDGKINNLESAQLALRAIENTTVILLDGNISNFYEFAYHEKSLYLSQPVIMSETKNLVCTYYTNLSEENVETHHENTEYITFLADVTANGITANVYIYPNNNVNELYAEMFVNGTRITYRVTEAQTLEDFETDFARLEFVKIGDLLNETNTDITE